MRILIGCPLRQKKNILEKYLKSLNEIDVDGIEVDKYFILHNSPELKSYFKDSEYEEYYSENEYTKTENTHIWKEENLKDVVIMKNKLIQKVLQGNYDYFFLVDSDILLKIETLKHLLNQKKDIISEVFWTKWHIEKQSEPNAWTHDFYNFDDLEKIKLWRTKGVYEVGYTGACILIHRKVLEAGVNYTPIKNITFSIWEDRAFCIRAMVHGFQIYLDTHYPAFHLYRG